MKRLKLVLLLLSVNLAVLGCASHSVDDEAFAEEDVAEESASDSADSEEGVAATEEEGESVDNQNAEQSQAQSESEEDLGEEIALEEEQSSEKKAEEVAAAPVEEQKQQAPPQEEPVQPVIEEAQPIVSEESIAPPVQAQADNRVIGVKLVPNETGGAVVIETERPAVYTTRVNSKTNQFIIELENTQLPEKYKRPIISKDIDGTFGALDAYQSPGSTQARFVLQLKSEAQVPAVQTEGNSLIVAVTGAGILAQSAVDAGESASGFEGERATIEKSSNAGAPLSSASLNEFLSNNNKFYGKRISIETENMNVRDALHFITEESGLNMIIAEEVGGNISLKLREVPWDQALVLLMKTKRLGYSRQGNVLRIAPLDALKTEEEEANRLAQAKQTIEPLLVKMFQISYAKMDELQKNVKEFLSPRGKVISDLRTNSLVVTDIADHLGRVEKLIEKLDTMPMQVLIEGKVVEATERFSRDLGVNWTSSGQLMKSGSINMQPSFEVRPEAKTSGAFTGNLNIGVLDLLGTISATLALNEKENKVKVISSPRILTLSNEKANIEQVSQEPSKSVTNNNGVSTVSYSFVDMPLRMEVTPQVTTDSSIIMQLDVERTFKGDIVGTGDDEKFSVNKRKINTKVLVRNGQTAVIGGIYKSDSSSGQTGVPFFRSLPFVGVLFRSEVESNDKSELIIFLTPRIVGQALSKSEGTPASGSF